MDAPPKTTPSTQGILEASELWPGLWVRGSPEALEGPLVGVVGTRKPDARGIEMARKIAHAVAGAGAVVLSGGALGIDAVSHAEAMEAGGRTVVVLPCGLEHCYPQRHGPLFRAVLRAGGALVSPFHPSTPPCAWTFPRRNEALAELCDVLVVVQAPRESGSLLAARAARRRGRRLLVVPASPGDPRGAGCLQLLREGATLCSEAEEVVRGLAEREGPLFGAPEATGGAAELRPRLARSRARAREGCTPAPARARERTPQAPEVSAWALEGDEAAIEALLRGGPLHSDQLVERSGIAAPRVRRALLTLTLLGVAQERSDGRWGWRPPRLP